MSRRESVESRTVRPTSSQSATTEDIVLRDGPQSRLLFRPMFVKNLNAAQATVKGTFVYQRKGRNDDWVDVPAASLNGIKIGEEYRLNLHSEELLKLFDELKALYQLHEDAGGIPRGRTRYIKATETVLALSQMTDDDFNSVMAGAESLDSMGEQRGELQAALRSAAAARTEQPSKLECGPRGRDDEASVARMEQ